MSDFFSQYSSVKSNLLYGDLSRESAPITFLIPTYKRPQKIQRALRSILNQKTKEKYDIVVVDNEPERNTETEIFFRKICSEHKNIYYYKNEENIGMFPNWNRCYKLARGEWCCICMSDDELTENYLDRVISVEKRYHFDCIRVGSNVLDQKERHIHVKHFIDRRYHNRKGCVHKISKYYFVFRAALPPSGMFVRKNVVIDLGGYNLDYFPTSDYEFDSRLVTHYKVGMLWERLCVTHTDESTSMQTEVIAKSIHMDFKVNDQVYKQYFRKYKLLNAMNNIKTYISIYKLGLNEDDYSELEKKYNKKMYMLLYRMAFLVYRIIETIV